MRFTTPAASLLLAAVLPLSLAACSSGTSASGSSGGSTAATKDPDAGLLTGTQLKKALAPASFFASGFAVDPGGERATGNTYQQQATDKAAAAHPDCGKLDGTAWIGITGVDGVSFAQNDYINKDTSEDIAQEIDVYQGTTAAGVMQSLRKAVAACQGYQDSQTHTKVKLAGTATAGLGDEAYTVTLTDSAWQNGTTLIAARVGTAVVSVLSTDGHDNGAATAKKLAATVVAAVKKA